jgi:predicted ester cyclase
MQDYVDCPYNGSAYLWCHEEATAAYGCDERLAPLNGHAGGRLRFDVAAARAHQPGNHGGHHERNNSEHDEANGSALDPTTLVARLKKAGEAEVLGGEQAEIDSYFDTKQFRFHAPDGFETDFDGLNNYFKSVRAAFEDRSIRRGIIVVQGNYVACQTWIGGTFAREFTQSPVGSLPPNGQRVVFDLLNLFRFDDQGRLIEEWVQTDYRSFLQLGATGK